MSREISPGQAQGGLSFLGALTIAFIVLKLCHVIAWSWWWVLAPLWIATLIVVLIILGGAALVVWIALTEDERKPKRTSSNVPAATALHGPVRKWGYRTTPRSDAERLREDHERIWGDR
jgi:Flp pilus assembly protein TadB